MKKFENKVIFITGASSGIGKASALAAADEGGKVVIADLPDSNYQEVISEIKGKGGDASFVPVNVADSSSVKNAVDETVRIYGRLDVALNNAGVGSDGKFLADTSDEAFMRTISINLAGVFYCMKYEIQQFLKQGGGSIVNMSSAAGICGEYRLSPYCASKHGVLGLTKTAAIEYASQNIRVTAICPTYIETPMLKKYTPEMKQAMANETPVKRLGTAEEVARVFVFLGSDDASYVNGSHIVVDGATTAR